MSAEFVRSHYGVDYKRGDRVTVDGKPGTVVSFPGPYLGVRLDGEKRTSRCHPTWRVARSSGHAAQGRAGRPRADAQGMSGAWVHQDSAGPGESQPCSSRGI